MAERHGSVVSGRWSVVSGKAAGGGPQAGYAGGGRRRPGLVWHIVYIYSLRVSSRFFEPLAEIFGTAN
jgi:hypothetical protein